MTTRVDFYLVDDTAPRAWLALACRLTEKAFSQAHRVCIAADSPEQAATLDKLLWTFRDRSFVPHAVVDGDAAVDEPVLITAGAPPAGVCDVLVNLRPEAPGDLTAFARIVEPLDGDPTRRRRGRERFKHYREHGLAPESHNLSANDH